MSLPVQEIVTHLEHIQTITYFDVASTTILFYNYILTFSAEVSLIWYSPWSVTKFLFLITRYLPFLNNVLALYFDLAGTSENICNLTNKGAEWTTAICLEVAEIILALRVWAVWGKDRRLTIGLLLFNLLCWGPSLVIVGIYIPSVTFGPPIPGTRACLITGGSPILFICWVLLAVYDSGLLVLMIIRRIRHYRNSALLRVIYRDGILYFLCLFTLSAVNVAVIVALPPDLDGFLGTFELVIHSTFTSLILFNIREQAKKNRTYRDGLTDHGTVSDTVTGQSLSFHAVAGDEIKSGVNETWLGLE